VLLLDVWKVYRTGCFVPRYWVVSSVQCSTKEVSDSHLSAVDTYVE